uniref:FYVE zinc finger domain-containing protein n=1 Tax=Globisporangium ultimum (strain ATCC 200006 / CBS 805.95 / DAOM BR144) TaxID=431595 RepID=K3WD91_GLOUD
MQVQESWGEKSGANFCFHCHFKFTSSKDKHRCKCCGYIFCAPCTPKACRKKLPGTLETEKQNAIDIPYIDFSICSQSSEKQNRIASTKNNQKCVDNVAGSAHGLPEDDHENCECHWRCF